MIEMIDYTQVDWNMIVIVLVFAFLDIISGTLKAFKLNTFSSSLMREGLMHKAATMLVMVCAGVCDVFRTGAGVELPFGAGIVDAFGVVVIVMEICSILENCIDVNPELGNMKLMRIFGLGNLDDGEDE